jgi:hypothetical protein
VAAEVSASLRHRFRRGEAELTYLRTQVPLLGQPGLASVEGVTASFGHGFGRSFRVALAPAAFTTRRPGFSARVVRLGLSAGWRLTRDLELSGSHQFNLQNGGLARAPEEIARNTFFLRLVAGRAAP